MQRSTRLIWGFAAVTCLAGIYSAVQAQSEKEAVGHEGVTTEQELRKRIELLETQVNSLQLGMETLMKRSGSMTYSRSRPIP